MAKQRKLQPKKLTKRREVRHYVKEWRTKRGLTQDQLAERVERSRGLISQLEIGETELTEEMIFALGAALSCDPWDLLRVNPLMEGTVVDITDALRGKPAEIQAEALGFIRGLVSGSRN